MHRLCCLLLKYISRVQLAKGSKYFFMFINGLVRDKNNSSSDVANKMRASDLRSRTTDYVGHAEVAGV